MNPSRAFLILMIGLVAPLGAAERYIGEPARIWTDADVEHLDLLNGAGGSRHAPRPAATYTFLRNETKGASPKFDVTDDEGVRWRVKLGKESQSETAATRLVWAGGYFVDEVYYLPVIKVTGVPKKFLSREGTVAGARLERRGKETKKSGDWSWSESPFDGTKELNGLRVLMALINNWDLKTANNAIIDFGGERRYFVSDLGASFGKTGGLGDRSKDSIRDYEQARFIAALEPEYVNFVLHSRPFFLLALFDPYHYAQLTKRERVGKHIPRTHALWIGRRLARLSNQQVLDCFRAAGYSPYIAGRYTAAVRKRIAELNSL